MIGGGLYPFSFGTILLLSLKWILLESWIIFLKDQKFFLVINFSIWYFQSGCCKPPTECGYVYVNETIWNPGVGTVVSNPDCYSWNNDQGQLCYSCNSCKAGVLASLKKSWRKVSVINIVILIILVIVYVVACAAFRNNRRIDNDEAYGATRMTKAQPSRIQF